MTNKLFIFYRRWSFITTFTSACHWPHLGHILSPSFTLQIN